MSARIFNPLTSFSLYSCAFLLLLWLIVAFGGYMISVFITIVGIIFWSIALVIRLKQNKLARQYVRMQCTTCGTEFDVARSELMKGGNGK